MRVALVSDSAVIGRSLSDLLALLQYEVLATADAGTPQIRYQAGELALIAPDGTPQSLAQPLTLRGLAQQLKSLQSSARGAPLALAQGWRLEPLARMLHHANGQHVPLTEKECSLLAALHATLPQAEGREQLLKKVWAYEGDVETHTLETHIYRLRQKLAELTPPPADIVTVEGTYKLVIE